MLIGILEDNGELNVVYGDTLQFEGDILRDEFKRDPLSNRAKNPDRKFRYLMKLIIFI